MTNILDVSFRPDDGGRAAAGFVGEAGDCVPRALAIAARIPYREAYDALADAMRATGKARSARNGVSRKAYEQVYPRYGGVWVPTMLIGQGCTTRLRADELPAGRLICRVSKHHVAVIDGIIHDTHDPSREGTRCVYGYWVFPS